MNTYLKSIFHSLPPTGGHRVALKDYFIWRDKIKETKDRIEEECRLHLQVPFAYITSTATTGLYFILLAIAKLTSARTVIVPAYICPYVLFGILRAGFKIKICDTNGLNFNFDMQRLADYCSNSSDIAAILATHLGGIPADMEQINQIIKNSSKPIFAIEDAAQSLGAFSAYKPVGSLGDFAIFSFAPGKGPTFYEGGLLVAKDKNYSRLLIEIIKQHEKKQPFNELYKLFLFLGYSIFYRPSLFFWVFSLSQNYWIRRNNRIKVLREYFSDNFPIHSVSNFRTKLGYGNFSRLDQEFEQRKLRAKYYLEKFKNTESMKFITEINDHGDIPSYNFMSVIVEHKREEIFNNRELRSLGVSLLYAKPVPEYPYLKQYFIDEKPSNYKNATYLSDHLLTLTTVPFITLQEIDFIQKSIKSILCG
jgi:perosamine synthetase